MSTKLRLLLLTGLCACREQKREKNGIELVKLITIHNQLFALLASSNIPEGYLLHCDPARYAFAPKER